MANRFKDIQDAVIFNRFKEPERNPHVMRWITSEYAWLWHTNDLSFKQVSAMDAVNGLLPVVMNVQAPVMPAAFAEVTEGIYDEAGVPLEPKSSDEFATMYRGVTSTGPPRHYTIVNRQIYLGPTPWKTVTFTIGFRRKLAHLNGAGAVVAGPMVLDDDQPLWLEVDHDELLIAGARSRGKKRAQDPTWMADAAERDELLEGLIGDYDIGGLVKAHYPRDPL